MDYEFIYVNPRTAEIFGYERNEVIGLAPRDIVAEGDKDRVDANLRKRSEDEVETVQHRFNGQHSSSEILDIVVQGQRIVLNNTSAVAGVLLEIDDIPPTSLEEGAEQQIPSRGELRLNRRLIDSLVSDNRELQRQRPSYGLISRARLISRR